MSHVVPPVPPKLRALPTREQIGDVYADDAEYGADLAAWEAEESVRAQQLKLRAAALDKLLAVCDGPAGVCRPRGRGKQGRLLGRRCARQSARKAALCAEEADVVDPKV